MKRFGFHAATLAAIVFATAGMAAFARDSVPGPALGRAEITDGLTLVASLSERSLNVMLGDSLLETYDVSVGKDEHPTPNGTFNIRKLVWNPRWVPPDEKWAKNKTAKAPGDKDNPMKVVKMFFREPDYYIHGTDNVESLGSAGSHGCLRMDPDEAAQVAKWLMEHGGEPREENWFMRILHARRDEKIIHLKNPIPLTITE